MNIFKRIAGIVTVGMIQFCLTNGGVFAAGSVQFKEGDSVELIKDESLSFNQLAFKVAKKGEVLTVILQRDNKVFVTGTDVSGKKIALSLPAASLQKPDVAAAVVKPDAGVTLRVATPEESSYLVTTDAASGSAFLAQMDGAVYLVTNFHVLEAAKKIECKNPKDVIVISDGAIEVAADRDLVRIPVKKDFGMVVCSTEKIGDAVSAYGNSGGQNVVTKLDGQILGLGPKEVEVSCEFIPGNSGGPIANAKGEVVGLATYVKSDSDVPDWIKKGTRFSGARRFGMRITHDIEWTKVQLPAFQAQSAITAKEGALCEEFVGFAKAICSEPFRKKLATEFSGNQDITNLVTTYNSACKEYDNIAGSSVTVSELNAINSKFRGRLHSHISSLTRAIRLTTQDLTFRARVIDVPFIRNRSNETLKDMAELADFLDKNAQEMSSKSLFSFKKE